MNRPDDAGDGILVVWNDCAAGHEAQYEHWYQSEHLPERLGIPGFIRGRRYEALSGSPQFFTYYETRDTGVLTSAAYRARLNAPSVLTRQIMSGIFINMVRSLCRCTAREGNARGSFALTLSFDTPPAGWPDLTQLLAVPGVVRAESWLGADQPSEQSAEEKLRGADQRIAACLFVETLREADLDVVQGTVQKWLSGLRATHRTGTYRLLCELAAD